MSTTSTISVEAPKATVVDARKVALDKIIAHYQRLRVGQLKRKHSKHKKRIASLQKAQETLQAQRAWVPQQAFQDALGFQLRLRNESWAAGRTRPVQTREQEIAWQQSFSKEAASLVVPERKVRPVQEKPLKRERQYVSVHKQDLKALVFALENNGDPSEALAAVKKAARLV